MGNQRFSRKQGFKRTKSLKKCEMGRKKQRTGDEKLFELNMRGEGGFNEGEEGTKVKLESIKNEIQTENIMSEIPRIPLPPSDREVNSGVFFVLERASLVLASVGRRYQILNADEHADFLRRKNMDPYDYRPDIVHAALLQIMRSRLCMAGKVRAIFVKTVEGILIKVEPHVNIPNNLRSFCAMMSKLLQKFSIKAKGKREKLLRLVENPVTQHLPVNSVKIGFSFSSQKAVHVRDYVSAIKGDVNLVFVVGAMAHGKINSELVDDFISVCGYPLSVGDCLRRICVAMERKWRIFP